MYNRCLLAWSFSLFLKNDFSIFPTFLVQLFYLQEILFEILYEAENSDVLFFLVDVNFIFNIGVDVDKVLPIAIHWSEINVCNIIFIFVAWIMFFVAWFLVWNFVACSFAISFKAIFTFALI